MYTALRDRFESAGTAPRQAKALAGAGVWVVANMEIGALLCEMAATLHRSVTSRQATFR